MLVQLCVLQLCVHDWWPALGVHVFGVACGWGQGVREIMHAGQGAKLEEILMQAEGLAWKPKRVCYFRIEDSNRVSKHSCVVHVGVRHRGGALIVNWPPA